MPRNPQVGDDALFYEDAMVPLAAKITAFQDGTTAILTVFRPGGEASPVSAQYSYRPQAGFWTWPQ